MQSLDCLTAIHSRTEGGVGLHLTGSIRLVRRGDEARALEARRHVELASLYDHPELPTTLVTPDEIARKHPLVDASTLQLGVFTPEDGDVCPNLLTAAVARAGARPTDGHAIRYFVSKARNYGTFPVRFGLWRVQTYSSTVLRLSSTLSIVLT